MPLRVYNYLGRELERFRPSESDVVGLYVCGPTVNDYAHLGHARTYIAMDAIVRYLRFRGYRVRHVRGITDVGRTLTTSEDRIVRAANREGVAPMELAETYARAFEDDMDALHVLRPTIASRATGHIPEVIVWVKDLVDQGYAYEVDGNVYFSTDAFPSLGRLNRHTGASPVNAGVAPERRRNPADFPLWRRAEPSRTMAWQSPWGDGYPEWHSTSSVMAHKHLGTTFDIHGGGLESATPHNDREIAQSEAHNGVAPATYWLLVGPLRVGGAKMSKSRGNQLAIRDALKLYSPEALRCFVFSSHYRNAAEYSREALLAAQRAANHLHQTARQLRRKMQSVLPLAGTSTAALADVASLEGYRADFREAMDDDFDTPRAMGVIFALVKEINRVLAGDTEVSVGTLSAMDKMLRDLAGDALAVLPAASSGDPSVELVEDLVDYLLALRDDFSDAQDRVRADAIYRRLTALGIAVDDGPSETTWHLKVR
jgi:cysteinyl-tRNA synthetase